VREFSTRQGGVRIDFEGDDNQRQYKDHAHGFHGRNLPARMRQNPQNTLSKIRSFVSVEGSRRRSCPTLGGEPGAGRDGVIRFQHRRKICSILIRNTVVPIAIRTALTSYLTNEVTAKPGVVMSNIPLDVQRRCERRWAAQFSRPTESVATRNQRPKRESLQIAGSDKGKRKAHRGEAAR
jgi:hypothetical protein